MKNLPLRANFPWQAVKSTNFFNTDFGKVRLRLTDVETVTRILSVGKIFGKISSDLEFSVSVGREALSVRVLVSGEGAHLDPASIKARNLLNSLEEYVSKALSDMRESGHGTVRNFRVDFEIAPPRLPLIP